MPRLQRLLAALLTVGLAVGATASFVVAQTKKAETPPVGAVDFRAAQDFSPSCGRPRCSAAPFSFRLNRAQPIDVRIVEAAGGRPVRTLLRRASRPAGRVRLAWRGDTDGGGQAAGGRYRVRIQLYGDRRELLLANEIALDTEPPTVEVAGPSGRVVSAVFRTTPVAVTAVPADAGDRPARARLVVTRTLPGGGRSVVYAEPWTEGGRALPAGRRSPAWDGTRGGRSRRPVPPGSYILTVEVRDLAGNTVRREVAAVRVRGVELSSGLHLETSAPEVTLTRLQLRDGSPDPSPVRRTGPPDTVRLPAPARAGLYVVRAEATPFSAWAPLAAPGRASVLVLVPTYTWQAANSYDGDLDGAPDQPPEPLDLGRPLPAEGEERLTALARRLAPLAARHPGFGAVTDAAVETAGIPGSARVVVLRGLDVWTPGLAAALDRFRARGGRVLLLGGPARTRARRDGSTLIDLTAAEWQPAGARVYRGVQPALHGVVGRAP